MLLEKGGKYMETHKATIVREKDIVKLILESKNDDYEIILSEEDPNKIKNVFNNLIIELKSGKFEYLLEDSEDDLFTNVCREYITQLNSEIANVYGQLKSYELLESDS